MISTKQIHKCNLDSLKKKMLLFVWPYQYRGLALPGCCAHYFKLSLCMQEMETTNYFSLVKFACCVDCVQINSESSEVSNDN